MNVILQCPVCGTPLLNSADGYQCSNNHTFDAAREGYVNVLLAHKKHSKEPGDSKEMIQSRRRFLDLGHYDRISDCINEAIAENLSSCRTASCNILDAGCGEGFYLSRLKTFLTQNPATPVSVACYGVDISKFAVRQATKRDRDIDWFVASIIDLPFAQASLDLVVNVFSPAAFPEFSRVLKDTGALLIVSPGPKHLNGLREIIYQEAKEHAPPSMSKEAYDLFSLFRESKIRYPLELKGRDAIMDLLSMTPYFWNIDLKTKARVEALDRLACDVDVDIRIYRKR